ncbi:hypothetical protein ACA30_13110 [Virgibacillus soli]|nr:hypothetical protein ACA30_13110 [Virgibacillus soli]
MTKRRTTKTYLVCSCCQNVYIMFRLTGNQRKDGHVKHLWCYSCKETTAHIEDKWLLGKSKIIK